jgi:hypothetical protein
MTFSYTRFPVKKINVGNFFKITRKFIFNYSLYSHPEIRNFRVWHLKKRPWSSVEVKQWSEHDSKKPKDPTREHEKLRGPSQKSAESCETSSFVQLGEKLMTKAHMQKGEDLEDSGTNVGRRRLWTGPKWDRASRPRSASPARFEAQSPPFDLGALWGYFITPWQRATHQSIRHPPPRSIEAWGTPSRK